MAETPRKIEITAGQARLVGRFYPAEGRQRAALLIHGATGVPQGYYRHLAAWATGQGIAVLTYDYSDFAASLAGHPRDSRVTFADWVVRDQAAAQAKLAELVPEGPLWILGHSLGGLGLPFHRYDARVSRIFTVGAGLGHYSDHPWSYRPKALAFWFAIGPVATALAGYMPGRRLLLGADLPAGVYWQWRRWCTRRDFYARDIGRSLPQPVHEPGVAMLRIGVATDDQVVPPVAVRRYAERLASGGATYVEFSPAEIGARSLGHIGILGRGQEALWPKLLCLEVREDLTPREKVANARSLG